MPANRGLWVALNGDIGTTPLEARLAWAGTVAENSPGVPRQGLLFQSATNVVTGKSDMSYGVAPCHPVTNRGTDDGVYLFSITGSTTVTTTAAPSSGSRYDLVFVKQDDTDKADPDNLPVVGVVQGQASSTPSKPYGSVPVGAYVLAEALVTAGATATNGSGVTITQVWRHTAMRGAPIPVRNAAERDELTAFKGLQVARLDYDGLIQRFTGTRWFGSMSDGGSFTIPSIANGGNATVNVTFSFPGAPAVTVAPNSSRLSESVASKSANGATFVFDNRSGGGSSSGIGYWTATFSLT